MQPKSELSISNGDIKIFGQWSHDVNPLHVDPEAASRTYFGKPIAHGILMIIQSLLSIDLNESRDLLTLEAEFRRPVFPGEKYFLQGHKRENRLEVSLQEDQGTCLLVNLTFGDPPAIDQSEKKWLNDLGRPSNSH